MSFKGLTQKSKAAEQQQAASAAAQADNAHKLVSIFFFLVSIHFRDCREEKGCLLTHFFSLTIVFVITPPPLSFPRE